MLKSLIEKLSRVKFPYHRDSLVDHGVTFFANSPLYWSERAEELKKLTAFTPKNEKQAKQKHEDLLAVIESLKVERKSYQSDKSVSTSGHKLADAEIIKLSLSAAKSVKALRESYPNLTATSPEEPEISLSSSLRSAFQIAASKGMAKGREWAETVKANPHVQKTTQLAVGIAKAAATRVANDAKELSAPLRQNLSDAARDAKIVLKEQLDAIPVIRNIDWSNPRHRRLTTSAASYVAIFGLAAGVAFHSTTPAPEQPSPTAETKPINLKFEQPKTATGPAYARADLKDSPRPRNAHKYDSKPQKAPPVYVTARKNFSDDDAYSSDGLDNEAHKKLKGHRLSGWNWDALLKPKYRDVVVKAAEKLLNMHPSEVFHKGLLMTESGGRQFDDRGRVVTSSAGATGAAQVMPDTARAVAPRCTGDSIDWKKFRTDINYNIKVGKCYFKEQHETFDGNNIAALLAYNSGPGSDTQQSGLKYNLRRSGISLSNDGETMVKLISSIRNTENRHYPLITMAKMGLLDPNELGEDVTNGSRAFRHAASERSSERAQDWRNDREAEAPREPTLRYEFQRETQVIRGGDLSSSQLRAGNASTYSLKEAPVGRFYESEGEQKRHETRTAVLANSNDPIEQAATLD